MGNIMQGSAGGGPWSKEELLMHINILELKAAYLVLITFTNMFQNKSVHVQMYNMVALKFVVKLEGTTSHELTNIAKEIRSFLP